MSFLEKNENFVRIKFHHEMRGMSLDERIVHYNQFLKEDTNDRLKKHFESSSQLIATKSNSIDEPTLFSENRIELDVKKADYEEALNLFKDFEFETILKSIYFEKMADELFWELRILINECVPTTYFDRHDLLKMVNNRTSNNSSGAIIKILQEKFTSLCDLSLSDWNSESKTKHQTINKFCIWIGEKLKSQGCENEIADALFHYTKYWNIQFSRSVDDTKRIVFLSKLSSELESNGIKHHSNINEIISILKNKFTNLLCAFALPPFLVSKEDLMSSTVKYSSGYAFQIERFNRLRIESNQYLENYEGKKFDELFELLFGSNIKIRELILDIIVKKITNGNCPTQNDFDLFELLSSKIIEGSDQLKRFEREFCRMNYWFSKHNYV